MAKFEIDFLENYDDASVIAELQRIAKVIGKDTVTKADIVSHGRMSHATVARRFGSLRQALTAAGLRSTRFMKATDEELTTILIDLWQQVLEKEGRNPEQDDLAKYGFAISHDTISRRFGGWRKALVKAHASVTEDSVEETKASVAQEAVPRKREALSLRKRFFVFKRDHFACVRCGKSGVGARLEVHHRHPFAKKGSDRLSNLETLCFECNRGQSDDLA